MERVADLTAAIRAQPPGHEFLKSVWLIARHKGQLGLAATESPRFRETSPNLERVLKAAVAAGSTGAADWGNDLSGFYRLASEWVASVSRRTILGRLNAVRVAFLTRTIVETAAATAAFVKPGGPILVRALALANTAQLAAFKVGVIIAVTNESLQLWSSAVQANLNDRLSLAVARGLDLAFIDPDSAGVADQTPASVLSGVSPLGDFTNSAAGALADIATLLQAHVAAGSDLDRVLIAMHPSTCLTLSLMQNTDGSATFPRLNATGGDIVGVPVVTSVACQRSTSPPEKIVAALDGGKILLADDGGIDVSASRLAAIQQDDGATQLSTGATAPTNLVSMYQTESTAIKATRFVNFQRAVTSGVSWMTSNF
jgi:hypothetical protein